jgi:hypothetical protein
VVNKERNTGSDEDEWATGATVKRSSLISLNASLTIGLLFFFALSGDIMEKKLIIYVNFFPFAFFIRALLHTLRNNRDKAIQLTQWGLVALTVSISIISFDSVFLGNYLSNNINHLYNYTSSSILSNSVSNFIFVL